MCSGLVANLHSPTLYATAQTILCQIDGVLGVRLGEGPIPREYGRRPYLDYPIHKSTAILPNLEYRTTRSLGFGIGLPYQYAPLLAHLSMLSPGGTSRTISVQPKCITNVREIKTNRKTGRECSIGGRGCHRGDGSR